MEPKEWTQSVLAWCQSAEWLARQGRELQATAGVQIAPDVLELLDRAAGRMPKKAEPEQE